MKEVIHNRDNNNADDIAYTQIKFDTWNELKKYLVNWNEVYKNQGGYVCRGHSNSNWILKPSLERIRPVFGKSPFEKWYQKAEQLSLERFKRAIHLYAKKSEVISSEINVLEWLSIMQHYGAATRLLDFTASPLISTFFAISSIPSEIKEISIWAIPISKIDKENVKILKIESDDIYQTAYDRYQNLEIGLKDGIPIIGYSYLEHPNERVFQQKGYFLYSMCNNESFLSLLSKYFLTADDGIQKLTLNINDRNDLSYIINDLQLMNISYSTLFPGIEGYTKDTFLYQYIVNT